MSSTSTHARSTYDQPSSHESVPQIVINTRPIARAAPLTQYLQAAGLSVVEIPMLALQPRPTTEEDKALMRAWLAGKYKALVIISPTAATLGLEIWQALLNHRQDDNSHPTVTHKSVPVTSETLVAPSPIIAVGQATAAVLNQANIDESNYQVLQPESANNEGMLAMPEIESLQSGDKLLIWRGLGGRRLLVDTLQARGVDIDSIAWYKRTMPTEAMAQYQQWQQDFYARNKVADTISKPSKPVVVVSSGTAFEHWTTIVEGEKAVASVHIMSGTRASLSDFTYVVLGERLASMVGAQRLNYWRVEDLSPSTILSAINSNT